MISITSSVYAMDSAVLAVTAEAHFDTERISLIRTVEELLVWVRCGKDD